MRTRTIYVALAMSSAIIGASHIVCAAQDAVSICFAPEDTISCQQDITEYPHIFQAYLVLRNCSSPGGVSGWEATIDLPAEIVLGGVTLGSDAVNFGSGTSFHVGYAPPLAQSSTIILAALTLIATAPGSIYLHGNDPPSIPATFAPLYVDGADPNHLVAMNYDLGSPFHPVLAIGAYECPEAVDESTYALADPDTSPFSELSEPLISYTTISESPVEKELSSIDWEFLFAHSVLAARGRLLSKEAVFVVLDNRPEGIAQMRFAVTEAIFGPVPDTLTVWATGIDKPGQLIYVGAGRFKAYDECRIDEEALLFPIVRGNVAWISDWRIFPLDDITKAKDASFGTIRAMARAVTIQGQCEEATGIGLLSATESPREFRVVASYKALSTGSLVRLHEQDAGVVRSALASCNNERALALVFSRTLASGELVMQAGGHSTYAVTPSGIYNIIGMPLSPTTMSYLVDSNKVY